MSSPGLITLTSSERKYWDDLGQSLRHKYESHASFLSRNGYLDSNVETSVLAVKIAYSNREADARAVDVPEVRKTAATHGEMGAGPR